MKINNRFLSLILLLFFVTLPILAQIGSEDVYMRAGETKTLNFPYLITSKTLAGKPGCWSNRNTDVSVTSSSYSSVSIKANNSTGNSYAIVRVDYYYDELVGKYIYRRTGAFDYKVHVEPAPPVMPTGISVNPTNITLGENITQSKIYATVYPVNAETGYVWTTSNSAVATVSGTGASASIYKVGAGSCKITVRTDNGYYATCNVTVNDIQVTVNSISLNKTNITLEVGKTEGLTATVLPSNATNKNVIWSSSDATVASVSSAGVVNALKSGSTTITATTQDGNKTSTCIVNVNSEMVSVTGVSLDKTSITLDAGKTESLTVTVLPSNTTNKNVIWSSSDATVASVSSAGVVNALKAGSATITATTQDGNKTATCTVNVNSEMVSATGVSLDKTSITLDAGKAESLTATVLPSNATNKNVIWSSSDATVASVGSAGVVNALKAGSATITATTQDGNKTATCTVSVNSEMVSVTGVSLDKTSITLDAGKTESLTATVLPSNATNRNVIWSSSDATVASVGSTGVVNALKSGSATITATTQDGNKTATCAVSVNDFVAEPTAISIQKSISLISGFSATITPILTPVNARSNYEWMSNDTLIVKVNSIGKITAIAPGKTNIKVTTDNGLFGVCEVITTKSPINIDAESIMQKMSQIDALRKRTIQYIP